MLAGLKLMLFKQHQRCAAESSEQQLLSSPRVGQEQPQDHLYTRANSADPASLVKQTKERNEIFLFMLTLQCRASHLASMELY